MVFRESGIPRSGSCSRPSVVGSSIVGPPSRISSRKFPGCTRVGADRPKVVGNGVLDQFPGNSGIGRHRRVGEIGAPAAVGAAIHHGAIADAVCGHHHRPGDSDFLVERRRH